MQVRIFEKKVVCSKKGPSYIMSRKRGGDLLIFVTKCDKGCVGGLFSGYDVTFLNNLIFSTLSVKVESLALCLE